MHCNIKHTIYILFIFNYVIGVKCPHILLITNHFGKYGLPILVSSFLLAITFFLTTRFKHVALLRYPNIVSFGPM